MTSTCRTIAGAPFGGYSGLDCGVLGLFGFLRCAVDESVPFSSPAKSSPRRSRRNWSATPETVLGKGPSEDASSSSFRLTHGVVLTLTSANFLDTSGPEDFFFTAIDVPELVPRSPDISSAAQGRRYTPHDSQPAVPQRDRKAVP